MLNYGILKIGFSFHNRSNFMCNLKPNLVSGYTIPVMIRQDSHTLTLLNEAALESLGNHATATSYL